MWLGIIFKANLKTFIDSKWEEMNEEKEYGEDDDNNNNNKNEKYNEWK